MSRFRTSYLFLIHEASALLSKFTLVWMFFYAFHCAYQYLAPASGHHECVFSGFLLGELRRIHRCNRDDPRQCDHDITFFFEKLCARGHAGDFLKRVLRKFRNSRKPSSTTVFKRDAVVGGFLKAMFSRSTDQRALHCVLQRHRHWLDRAFSGRAKLQVGVAHSIQRSLFRVLYRNNWCFDQTKQGLGWRD